MKRIPLTQGKYAFVDDEDFERLNKYKWHANYNKGCWRAKRTICKPNGKWETWYMHRFIMNTPKGMDTDHENHNGLDNRKSNLRICTHAENGMNQRPQQKKTSEYKGVCWHKQAKKWIAQIRLSGQNIYLGCFAFEIEAALAYDIKAKELFRDYAYLNLEVK